MSAVPGETKGARRSGEVDRPADPHEQARAICLRQLAMRPRTRAQLATTLAAKGIEDQVAVDVLDRLADVGLVDDVAFAREWVRARHADRGLSARAIARELELRGVAPDTATNALGLLGTRAEEERARELVARKLPASRGQQVQVRARRLVGMLARKGYPPGLATRVVREQLALEPDVDRADRRFLDDLDGPLSDLARIGE